MSDHAWDVISLLRSGEWCPAPCGVREGCGCADAIRDAINAAIAAEREACAKIIDDNAEGSGLQSNNRLLVPRTEGNLAGTAYAAAIRARGKT